MVEAVPIGAASFFWRDVQVGRTNVLARVGRPGAMNLRPYKADAQAISFFLLTR
jgi:hypothetical protein